MLIAILVLVVLGLTGLRIAQEYQRVVIFRFAIIPLGIERSIPIDIRTRTVSAEQQETITMQQVMAMQAEAIREKRARIIKAEAEFDASVKLSAAAAQIMENPAALELRRMQMIAEVGAENNSTTVVMIPSDFVSLSHSLSQYLQRGGPT